MMKIKRKKTFCICCFQQFTYESYESDNEKMVDPGLLRELKKSPRFCSVDCNQIYKTEKALIPYFMQNESIKESKNV